MLGRICSELNPANGGTKPLTKQEWDLFMQHVDMTYIDLEDGEDMAEVIKRYEDYMAEYTPAESGFRQGRYE